VLSTDRDTILKPATPVFGVSSRYPAENPRSWPEMGPAGGLCVGQIRAKAQAGSRHRKLGALLRISSFKTVFWCRTWESGHRVRVCWSLPSQLL